MIMNKKHHDVRSIKFLGNKMVIIVDNVKYKIDIKKVSKKLFKVNEIERKAHKVSPSGYGIHWPLIDEDLTIDGLIRMADKANIRKLTKTKRISDAVL